MYQYPIMTNIENRVNPISSISYKKSNIQTIIQLTSIIYSLLHLKLFCLKTTRHIKCENLHQVGNVDINDVYLDIIIIYTQTALESPPSYICVCQL